MDAVDGVRSAGVSELGLLTDNVPAEEPAPKK
jgi:hypothetical protein